MSTWWILTIAAILLLLWLWIKKANISFRRPSAAVLGRGYVNPEAYYLHRFGQVPNETYLTDVDMEAAFEWMTTEHQKSVDKSYRSSFFDSANGKADMEDTLVVFKNKVLVYFKNQWVYIYFPGSQRTWVDRLVVGISGFKRKAKKKEQEIHIISQSFEGLTLKRLDIAESDLDLDLYYNDDFKEVDQLLQSRLLQEKDKGIVLLHGMPGTGKTSYLRYLIGKLTKRVLFVSPSVARNLMNPELIDLLIDHPNSILVIEDAEQVITDRRFNPHSGVSNLLNLSDGLLSDFLHVQVICTFNSPLSMVDTALMRQGRLIASYEFGSLSVEKANKLALHLGKPQVISAPSTLAQIANPDHAAVADYRERPIGFRTIQLRNE